MAGDEARSVQSQGSSAVRGVVERVARAVTGAGGMAGIRPRRRYHRDCIFVTPLDPGPRVPLDCGQRAVIQARLKLDRRPGGLTLAAAAVGRVMVDMLGPDGRLDPSLDYLAKLARVHVATVKRAVNQLKQLGFLDWTRRLLRGPKATQQTSNAYVLKLPKSPLAVAEKAGTHFAHGVPAKVFQRPRGLNEAAEVQKGDREGFESAARQLEALGRADEAANLRARAPS